MNIKISSATVRDRQQLIKYFNHYNIKSLIEKRVDCYIHYNHTIVAKNEGKIIGVLQWYVKENPQAGVVEFEEIYIKEEFRNKGIGIRLLRYAIQDVKNYFNELKIKPRKIFLFVNKKNKNALALYTKNGFQLAGKTSNLFTDNETELIYILDL